MKKIVFIVVFMILAVVITFSMVSCLSLLDALTYPYYEDNFSYSEIVNRYRTTEVENLSSMGSGVALFGGGVSGDVGGKLTTYYYVYDVTVTRNWYTRTWYYKDRDPTTERVYKDTESKMLVDTYFRTQ
jgi:hypothetical protein